MEQRFAQTAIEEIPELFSRLQQAVSRLEEIFPGRRFTLDGHLVGSLAEVIASYMYDIELLPNSRECHDGRCLRTGLNVQVKGTQKNRVAMYAEPEHLIVLKLSDGFAKEVYNGPGAEPWNAAGPIAKNGQKSISLTKLRILNANVLATQRLPLVRSILNND